MASPHSKPPQKIVKLRGSSGSGSEITPERQRQQRYKSATTKVELVKKTKPPKLDKKELSNRIRSAEENEIDLSALNLTELPTLPHKQWKLLDIGFNSFSTWPDTSPFGALEELNMTACGLTALAEELHHLKSLRKLILNGNLLMTLRDSVAHLSNLTFLNLANNRLESITPKISSLRMLEELNLTGNPLKRLPSEFSALVFLECLDLNGCGLLELPNEFPGMIRLLDLDLGNNHLTALPEDFGNMSRIVKLNLSDNKITNLPISMGACSMLNVCLLERNPIQDDQLLEKYNIGVDHLVDYLGKKMV